MQDKPKILVVDDRPENLLAMEHALVKVDARILKATSGNEALALMIRNDFALVLLDVQMPDMDGFEVASIMRESKATQNIPVVFVTAIDNSGEYSSKGYDVGAVDYISKPINPTLLTNKVNVFLRLSRQRLELEHEISNRRQAEEELREVNALLEEHTAMANSMAAAAEMGSQSKSEFLANMSHEIRTPMTAILGFTENLLDPDLSDDDKLSAIHTIRRNGEHLLQIINDILDISKIEAGKLEVEHVEFSPIQLVADVRALMSVRAEQKHLTLYTEFIGEVPETIQSDPTRLRQILVNLIGNAIKFTETGGVRLLTRFVPPRPEGNVKDHKGDPRAAVMQFDVLDTGLGMTKEQVSRLFQAFSQADTSTTRKFGGTGLGLNISKRLAEMLGGDIAAESWPGEGSVFRATVTTGPLDGVKMLVNPADATIVKPGTEAAQKADLGKLDCRILLAEDGPDNQLLISHVLKKAGAEVTVMENGKLALDAALAGVTDDEPFDVILMDIQMPVMDGYEATALLRQNGYTKPIIALTAHAMASDRKKCIDAGCDDYASKPIDRAKLIELIRTFLSGDATSAKECLEPVNAYTAAGINDT